ncbi:unnamed protein product [Caenorhabditis nigoni]
MGFFSHAAMLGIGYMIGKSYCFGYKVDNVLGKSMVESSLPSLLSSITLSTKEWNRSTSYREEDESRTSGGGKKPITNFFLNKDLNGRSF